VAISAASLLGTSGQTVALADIKGVKVKTVTPYFSPGTDRRTSVIRRPVLQTSQGHVPLTQVYSGGRGAMHVAQALNALLTPQEE